MYDRFFNHSCYCLVFFYLSRKTDVRYNSQFANKLRKIPFLSVKSARVSPMKISTASLIGLADMSGVKFIEKGIFKRLMTIKDKTLEKLPQLNHFCIRL